MKSIKKMGLLIVTATLLMAAVGCNSNTTPPSTATPGTASPATPATP